jgi:RNA polymerase sigma factor (sigma-70 family)
MLDQREVSFEALAPEQVSRGTQSVAHEMDPEQHLLQRVDRAHRQSRVKEVLGTLDSREQRIVARRLMADLDTSLTLQQLGKEFGVSSERVRQLEVRLKLKLAQQLCGLRESDLIKRELAA